MGHSKTSNYPTHTLIFFMEGRNNLMSASPILMSRPDISLKKLLLDLLVQLGTSGNCVWAHGFVCFSIIEQKKLSFKL